MDSCFGMQKVVDHRTDEYGRVFYKVQWEPTWEPAESLTGCQRLVDEFWASLNKGEACTKPEAKRKRSSKPPEKEEKRKLASVDRQVKMEDWKSGRLSSSPSSPLAKSAAIVKEELSYKQESMDSDALTVMKGGVSVSFNQTLQYIENFDNPYVRVVLVCKICSKEQSMKFSGNWKKHYLTHASDEEKPFKCSVCGKAFIQNNVMVKHMKSHANQPLKAENQL